MKYLNSLLLGLAGLFLSFSLAAQGTQLHTGVPIYHLYDGTHKVGIGTANPTLAPLHVTAHQSLVQLRLERIGSSAGISADIGGIGGNLIFYPGGYYNQNGNVVFETSGNVGIGISTPGYKLDVNGDGRINGVTFTASGAKRTFSTHSAAGLLRLEGGNTADTNAAAIELMGSSYNGSSPSIGLFTNNAQRMTIDNTGKVGIGTSTPTFSTLHISANSGSSLLRFERTGTDTGIADLGVASNNLYFWPGGFTNRDGDVYFNTSGNVGIGTTTPSNKLEVNGNALINGEVYSKKIKVSTSPGNWPDYVFEPNYQLRTLDEVETFIQTNKHLPEVPSAREVEKNGLDLGAMDATLLKKIEELTLYMIEMKKEIETLKKKNAQLEVKMKTN